MDYAIRQGSIWAGDVMCGSRVEEAVGGRREVGCLMEYIDGE